MVSEAQKRANEKYRRENVKQISLRFYPSEQDVYDFIKSKSNVSGYIKDLVRQDMDANAAHVVES